MSTGKQICGSEISPLSQVMRCPQSLIGNITGIGKLPTYCTPRAQFAMTDVLSECLGSIGGCLEPFMGGEPPEKMGVIVLHDVYGFNLPNSKYVADHFARSGYPTVMPDLFAGKTYPWAATEKHAEPCDTKEFWQWFDSLQNADFCEHVEDICDKLIQRLKVFENCSQVAIVGVGVGASFMERLCSGELKKYAVGISLSGYHTDSSRYWKRQCPIYYAKPVADPFFFPDTAATSLEIAGAEIVNFGGVRQGFVTRARCDESVDAADKALTYAITKIKKTLADIEKEKHAERMAKMAKAKAAEAK
jgi:carboxymethylenebutenolidase